jgi:ABC-type tungstate transport system permease subunit
MPSTAGADDSSTLTVVGTSDVSDSNLVAAVLQPDFLAFEHDHNGPVTTFNYVPKGTGDAINFAEAGTASALLVHAASLENQFVGGGFSEEPFGRAIFFGDFVLAGPANDPAGVMSGTSPSHDIVSAFEKIARAGTAGHADFVSRGGTPGTTVEEHKIWALTDPAKDGNAQLCTVSDANGGGEAPSTSSGDCSGTNPTAPSWYHVTGANQGQNVQDANACTGAFNTSSPANPNDCYVLTDRGTFDFNQSTHSIPNLAIVTRDNATSAPGGSTLLVNSFHAYAVNPDAVPSGSQLNVVGAEDFLNWLTSPAAQRAVGKFLSGGADSPPFSPDAAPNLTASKLPGSLAVGHSITVAGKLSNPVPGTPPLAGETVTLQAHRVAAPATAFRTVATTSTNGSGNYRLRYTPTASERYQVASGEIVQLENLSLHPAFGDELQPGSSDLGITRVRGAVTISRVSTHNGHLTLEAAIAPKAAAGSQLVVRAARQHHSLRTVAQRHIKVGARHFTVHFGLARGATYRLRAKYVDSNHIETAVSAIQSVRVP